MGKKKKNVRYRTRTVVKKVYRGAKGFMSGTTGKLLGAALYGGLREKVSVAIAPATSKIPAGEISDEIGMMALNYVLSRSLPTQLRPAARAGMVIEAARIGEFFAEKGLQGLAPNSTGTSSGGVF